MASKKNNQQNELVQLTNNCYRSQITVHPENWNEPGADPAITWYFSYRFYDPSTKEIAPYFGKRQITVKSGINRFKTLMAKRQVLKSLYEQEVDKIDNQAFNPISGQYMSNPAELEVIEYKIPPDTPFIKALNKAMNIKKCVDTVKIDLKSVIKYTKQAADLLRLTELPVNTIKKRHIKLVLDELGTIKGDKWTANNYNHYRAHLSMLFAELVEWDTIEHNPVEYISKRKVIKKKRAVLTNEQRFLLYNTLRAENYRLWLLMNIFYLAGCRRIEIMRVQVKNVDMANQKFKAVVMKGKSYQEVEYTITDGALPFWKMALAGDEVHPEDYVFSKGLKPGPDAINPKQITRRWNKWVKQRFTIEKDGFAIDADFYSLKHLHSTELSVRYGTVVAADFNNESVKMIERHYDTTLEERQHYNKKKLSGQFIPVIK